MDGRSPEVPNPDGGAGDAATLAARAEELEDEIRWDEALAAWEQVTAAGGGDPRALADAESGRARCLYELGRPDEALTAERATRRHLEEAGEPALLALSDALLAWHGGVPDDLDAALATAGAARDAIDRMADDPEAEVAGARARQVVARLLFLAGRADEGEREYVAARDRFADAGDDRRLARCDAALALDLIAAGRMEDAEARAEAAIAGLSMLDREVEGARMELVLGRIQAQGERFDEARATFASAGAAFAANQRDALLAEATHLEALMAAATGDDASAADLLASAVEVAGRAGLVQGQAASRLELGLALGRLGRLQEAEDLFLAAAGALGSAGDLAGAGRATYGVATTRRELGRLDEAVDAFQGAVAAFDAARLTSAASQARIDGAAVLAAVGRDDEALSWLDQAAEGFRADDEPLGVAMARRAWGAVAGHAGRSDGLAAVAEARAVFAQHGAAWEVAEADHVASRVLAAGGRLEEASTSARASIDGFGAAGDVLAVASALILLGRIRAQGGDLDEAGDRLREAVAVATEVGATPLAAGAHEALADVLQAQDRPEDARTHREAAARLLA